jgi:hypothetical protein
MVDITRFSDHVAMNTNRLQREEVIELQNQMNCNILDAEDNGETWLNGEIPVAHVTIIDEDEFFNRYFGADYDKS